jgi:hypothetical protein
MPKKIYEDMKKKFPHLSIIAIAFLAENKGKPTVDRIIRHLGRIGTDILVQTAFQTYIVDKMWDCIFYRERSKEGDCRSLMLFGPAGSGKSRCWDQLIERAMKKMPSLFEPPSPDYNHVPFLRIVLDGPVSVSEFYQAINDKLGFPVGHTKWSNARYKRETDQRLKRCNVMAILVDEAQWLTSRRGKKTLFEGTGLVKGLADRTQIPVFLAVSTADSPTVDREYLNWKELLKDETLVDRSPPIFITPFESSEDEDFLNFLRNVEPHYPFKKRPNFESLASSIFETVSVRNKREVVALRGLVEVLSYAAEMSFSKNVPLSEETFEMLKSQYISQWASEEVLGKGLA